MSDSRFRDRKFCLLLYPEDSSHAACIEQLKIGGYKFAAIKHDKDTWSADDDEVVAGKYAAGDNKKEHWHVVLKFVNAVWSTALAKELNISINYIRPCKSLDASLLYLVHEGCDDKYQYDHQEVFGDLKPALMKLLASDDEASRAMTVYNLINDSPGFVTYSEIFRKVCANGLYGDFRRMGSGVKSLIDDHNSEVKQEMSEASFASEWAKLHLKCVSMGWMERIERLERQGFYEKLDEL